MIGAVAAQAPGYVAIETKNFKAINPQLNAYEVSIKLIGGAMDGEDDLEKAKQFDLLGDTSNIIIEIEDKVDGYNATSATNVDLMAGAEWFLATESNRKILNWRPLSSIEPTKGRFAIIIPQENPTSRRALEYAETATLDSKAYHEIKIPGRWLIKKEDLDVFQISFTFFKWVRAFLAILQLYVIFIRPGTSNTHKTPIAWFAAVIFSLQILFYIPYICGNFGGVIDDIHRGMMYANRRVLGHNLSGASLSEKFMARQYSVYMNKWTPKYFPESMEALRFIENGPFEGDIYDSMIIKDGLKNMGYTGFVANPILENITELYILAFALLLPLFSKAVQNNNLNRLAKGIKSGTLICTAIPLITSSVTCIINFILVGSFDAFSIISLLVSAYLICIYLVQFVDFVEIGHESNFYRNSEKGLIDFDCHPDSSICGFYRRGEFIISLFIPTSIYIFSMGQILSSIIFSIFTLLLFLASLHLSLKQSWRRDLTSTLLFKHLHYLARLLHSLILVFFYFLYYVNGGTPLWLIKILSIAYGILLIVDLILLAISFLKRVYYEAIKVLWAGSGAHYPDSRTRDISPEAALQSIGLAKKNRTRVGGGVKGKSEMRELIVKSKVPGNQPLNEEIKVQQMDVERVPLNEKNNDALGMQKKPTEEHLNADPTSPQQVQPKPQEIVPPANEEQNPSPTPEA